MTESQRNALIKQIGEKTGLLVAIRYHSDPETKKRSIKLINRLEAEIDEIGRHLYPPLNGGQL